MIYKISEYQKKYPTLNVDSIAEQFASLDDQTKKEWATYTNNMKAIVSTCRVQRRIANSVDYEPHRVDEEKNDFYDG
jgi:hypothetical protein